MIWRRNGLDKFKREPTELVAEVVLLKLEGLVLEGWISSGWAIPREEEMVLKIFWCCSSGSRSDSFPCWCLREILMVRDVTWSWCGSKFDHYTIRKGTASSSRIPTKKASCCQISEKWMSLSPHFNLHSSSYFLEGMKDGAHPPAYTQHSSSY